jgi:cytosine/adenosine deaminase-related metal-dependent hydrolase
VACKPADAKASAEGGFSARPGAPQVAAQCRLAHDDGEGLGRLNGNVVVSLAVPIELNMAHDTPPIIKAQQLGLRTLLSTDVECRLTANLFTQRRTAMAPQRMFVNANKLGETNMPPSNGQRLATTRIAIEWATIDGARILRLEKKVESLNPDTEADIILRDAEAINVVQLNHVPGTFVLLMDRTLQWQDEEHQPGLAELRPG